jgi:glucose-6-phosphate isomerase
VNSFDQWGVELGKQLAGSILKSWTATAPEASGSDIVSTVRRWSKS